MAKVLLIDDSAFTMQRHKRIFTDLGHTVTTAGGYDEAMTILADEEFDLVITDLLMPGTDGFGVIGSVKEKFPNQKIAVVSADIQEARKQKSIEMGVLDHVNKPLDEAKAKALLDKAGAA